MKIGIFSDIHLEFRDTQDGVTILDHILEQAKAENVDVLVNAGDTHHRTVMRDYVTHFFIDGTPWVYWEVMGNHDYYQGTFANEINTRVWWKMAKLSVKAENETQIDISDSSVNFVLSTMWTDFNHSSDVAKYASLNITDFRQIQGATPEAMVNAFNETNQSIINLTPDIVVTHFAPGPGSIHPRWEGALLNGYFCPDATHTIKVARPKLWIHGHIHDPVDYVVDETRVIANPLGYPNETYLDIKNYKLKVVEI